MKRNHNPIRLTEEEFTLRAIRNLRAEGRKGIHVVYSGFNEAFRKYFGEDPVKAVGRMAEKKKVVVRPARGGATLYIAGEEPADRPTPDRILQKIIIGR